MAYLRWVWKRAGTSGDGLANQVREALPAAYAYCLDDCSRDESLADRWQQARLNKGVLIVAGRPVEFASDAAAELVREFGLRQRADLAVAISGMFGAVADGQDFALAAKKFTRAFARDRALAARGESRAAFDRRCITPNIVAPRSKMHRYAPSSRLVGRAPHRSRCDTDFHHGLLAPQRAAAKKLRQVLKGELEPRHDEAVADQVDTSDNGSNSELGDEDYRRIAAEYERLCGRQPELGDSHQKRCSGAMEKGMRASPGDRMPTPQPVAPAHPTAAHRPGSRSRRRAAGR